MAESTKIEWCDHTFNPWRGCTKVSEGCKFCYAEKLSERNPSTLGIWGPKGHRSMAAEAYWRQPLKWNHSAACAEFNRESDYHRPRVFCASLADVFEGDATMPATDVENVRAARDRLFGLIEATPNLDWLLLTKRPENVMMMTPESWREGLPMNVWLGTSCEDQKTADERIPHLLAVPASVRFLSCEPLLGPIDLHQYLHTAKPAIACGRNFEISKIDITTREIHWVIVGGESGPNARPMHPDWARLLRDQCAAASVPFLFKQWGEWVSEHHEAAHPLGWCNSSAAFVTLTDDGLDYIGEYMFRVGKYRASRLLDGVEHNGYPEVSR